LVRSYFLSDANSRKHPNIAVLSATQNYNAAVLVKTSKLE